MPTNRRFLAIALTSVLIGTMTFGITWLKTRIGRQPTRSIVITRSKKDKLVDLPPEVLVEILSLLEWKEILRVRQTCQRLRDASLARPVWLSLVQWYSATIQPRPFLPEKPLDLYTDRELENLILRWQSGKAGWTLTQLRQRRLSLPEDYFDCMHLVEGGRWLLFGTFCGSIKYCDLNALGASDSVTLVPTLFDEEALIDIRLCIDKDPDAEYLTFNLGIMTSRRMKKSDPDFPNPLRYARWIQVIRVTSDLDENGQVRGLRAVRLACFREEYLCSCDSFTLRGRYLAYSLYTSEPAPILHDGESIAIVDWMSVGSTSLTYPRKLIWRRRAEWLLLLTDNRLICHENDDFLLFDLNTISVTTVLPTQQRQPPRQHPIARLPLTVYAISKPYFVYDSIRFSVLSDDGIKGVVLPRSSGASYTMDCVDLFSESTLCTPDAHIGYDRAVVFWWPQLITLQYAWPDDYSCSLTSQKNTSRMPNNDHDSEVLFDEPSGRIVVYGYESNIQCIDLATI